MQQKRAINGWVIADYILSKPHHILGYLTSAAIVLGFVWFTFSIGAWAFFAIMAMAAVLFKMYFYLRPKLSDLVGLKHLHGYSKSWHMLFVFLQILLFLSASIGFMGLVFCAMMSFVSSNQLLVLDLALYSAGTASWSLFLVQIDPEPLFRKVASARRTIRQRAEESKNVD